MRERDKNFLGVRVEALVMPEKGPVVDRIRGIRYTKLPGGHPSHVTAEHAINEYEEGTGQRVIFARYIDILDD